MRDWKKLASCRRGSGIKLVCGWRNVVGINAQSGEAEAGGRGAEPFRNVRYAHGDWIGDVGRRGVEWKDRTQFGRQD